MHFPFIPSQRGNPETTGYPAPRLSPCSATNASGRKGTRYLPQKRHRSRSAGSPPRSRPRRTGPTAGTAPKMSPRGASPHTQGGGWAGLPAPARRRQAPEGHRPLHNPSPDRPKAHLVTHGAAAPGSGRALRRRGSGNCYPERERRGPPPREDQIAPRRRAGAPRGAHLREGAGRPARPGPLSGTRRVRKRDSLPLGDPGPPAPWAAP